MTCLHTSIGDDVSTHLIKFLFFKKIVSWRGHSFWLVKKLIKKKKWRPLAAVQKLSAIQVLSLVAVQKPAATMEYENWAMQPRLSLSLSL